MLTQVSRGVTQHEQIEFVLEECCSCGTPFMLPKRMQKVLIENHQRFYCPNGHGQSYCGKTEAQKLKEQLEQEKQRSAADKERLEKQWLEKHGEVVKLEKKLKRIHNGVCPCCNRTFSNLAKHMETQHPEVLGKEKYVHKKKAVTTPTKAL